MEMEQISAPKCTLETLTYKCSNGLAFPSGQGFKKGVLQFPKYQQLLAATGKPQCEVGESGAPDHPHQAGDMPGEAVLSTAGTCLVKRSFRVLNARDVVSCMLMGEF